MADSYKDFQREPSTPHQCVHESEKDGARCRGMAMANNYMCYAHRTDDVPTVIENDMFLIDDLSTHEAIQRAFCDVAGRLASNHIDLRRAELLITLLRAASRNLRDAGIALRLRTYTEEEQQFLQNTCWRKGYAPGNRPRPASITDEDIIAAINTGRFYCGNQKSIETEPNWNRATLSANSV
jgi:hypothetical protein